MGPKRWDTPYLETITVSMAKTVEYVPDRELKWSREVSTTLHPKRAKEALMDWKTPFIHDDYRFKDATRGKSGKMAITASMTQTVHPLAHLLPPKRVEAYDAKGGKVTVDK